MNDIERAYEALGAARSEIAALSKRIAELEAALRMAGIWNHAACEHGGGFDSCEMNTCKKISAVLKGNRP